MHALQEVWNICQGAFEIKEEETGTDDTAEVAVRQQQLFLLLSTAAVSGHLSNRTMQFKGTIQGQDILILIDSGSSHSFISSTVDEKLLDICPLSSPVSVQVADGGSILCSQEIPLVEWIVQGYTFHSRLKVIPLGSYDLIIGWTARSLLAYEGPLGSQMDDDTLWFNLDLTPTPAARD